ncbi:MULTISPECIES: hypothetical protein [unclassified Wolbachia]|uniref:hypothetical protein n=1 Tax=unclassified Wolbachia TaxID=2640676 RepID=UPI002231618D|nr:hypothetical protein [Wolbachia endosymbiont (group A) of Apoderus coryli]
MSSTGMTPFVVQITFANKCSYSCVSRTLLQYLHISHSPEQILSKCICSWNGYI